MPKIGSWVANFSATGWSAARVLEGCGDMSVFSTSASTRRFGPPRIGSGQVNTGRSTQSDLWPSAWPVLDPSKPQIGGSCPGARIFVFERSNWVGSEPSIQMYSALIVMAETVLTTLFPGRSRCVNAL